MPNQTISLTDYDPDALKIQRQQRLADMLQQQSMQDIPINSYNGIQAPISPFSVLAKALQAYGAKRSQQRADDQIQQYHDKDVASSQALVRNLMGPAQAGTVSTAPIQSQINATAPQLPGGPAPAPVTASMATPGVQGTGSTLATPSMQQQMAMLLAADGGPQTQAVRGAMLPQLMQRQSMDYQHQLGREDADYARAQPMSVAAQQTMEAQGRQARDLAEFNNHLPMNAAQTATNNLGWAQLNKPQIVPYGSQVLNPKTGQISGGLASAAPAAIDPTSQSLNAQTGLSQAAIEAMTEGKMPRGTAAYQQIQKEITDWSVKNGINIATLRPQAQATNKVLQQNMMRNNQSTILEHELMGTIKSVSPLLDAIGNGQLNAANVAKLWAGQQVNDPQVLAVGDQLMRLRNELATYNVVASGQLTENGTPRPVGKDDLAEAGHLLSNGISSGGLQGVLSSIKMTTDKNRNILDNAVEDSNQKIWQLFNVGKNYKRTAPPLNLENPGGGGHDITPQEAAAELARRRAAKK